MVSDVLVVVRRCPPYCLVAIGVGARLQEVPGASRGVASNLNNGTENIVDGKRDALTRTAEELPNGLAPLTTTEYAAIPDSIRREQRRQGIGIIVGIAIGRVAGFQLFDFFKILKPVYTAL